MDTTLLVYILIFSVIGSVGALLGAGVLLMFPSFHRLLRTPLLAYAVGTLMGAVFLGLIPQAIEHSGGHETVLVTVLVGFFGFFVLEKVMRIPHSHGHAQEHDTSDCGHHGELPAGSLILTGDAIHNFVDGVVIATAFTVSVPLGIVTSLAVVAHEVPQELGDFVILLESGWEPKKAFLWNFISALATVPGALLAYFALPLLAPYIPILLAVSAASFLYIATVDIAPILHHECSLRRSLYQMTGLFAGTGTIALIHSMMH